MIHFLLDEKIKRCLVERFYLIILLCIQMIRASVLFFCIMIFHGVNAQEDKANAVIWNSDRSAHASCINEKIPVCQVIVNKSKIDVSQVTRSNLGKLGIVKSGEYEKVITKPEKWIKNTTDIQMITFVTSAWRGDQRYTVSETVLIKNGKYFAR